MGTKAMLYFNSGDFRLPVYSHYDGYPNGVPLGLAQHLVDNPEVLQKFGKFMEELASSRTNFTSYVEFAENQKEFIDSGISDVFNEGKHRSIYFDMHPPFGIEFEYEYLLTKVDNQFNLTVSPYKYNKDYYTMAEYIERYTNYRPYY